MSTPQMPDSLHQLGFSSFPTMDMANGEDLEFMSARFPFGGKYVGLAKEGNSQTAKMMITKVIHHTAP